MLCFIIIICLTELFVVLVQIGQHVHRHFWRVACIPDIYHLIVGVQVNAEQNLGLAFKQAPGLA